MKKIEIKKGTKQIDPHQYEGRLDIEELIIADTVEVIGEAAFYGCSNLKKIIWGKHVHTIGMQAFSYCDSLKTLYLPNSIEHIQSHAFAFCPGLVFVEFEDNSKVYVTSRAFSDCTRLTCVILPDGLKSIYHFGRCPKLEDIFIPGTVTHIGHKAFSEIAATQIDLPDSIKKIDHQAFYNSKLTSVVVPDSVLTIEDSAFGFCSDLRSVEIGKSVVYIGRRAFKDCPVLSEVTFKSTIIGSIGTSIFKGCKNLKRINVPACAMDTYKRLLPKYLHRKLVGF